MIDFTALTQHAAWPTPQGVKLTVDLKEIRHSHSAEVRTFLASIDASMVRHLERVIQGLVDRFPDSSAWLTELENMRDRNSLKDFVTSCTQMNVEQTNAIEAHLTSQLSGAILETAARAIGDTQRYKLRKITRSWNNGICRVGQRLGIRGIQTTNWLIKSILRKEELNGGDERANDMLTHIATYVCVECTDCLEKKLFDDPHPHHVVRVFPDDELCMQLVQREEAMHKRLIKVESPFSPWVALDRDPMDSNSLLVGRGGMYDGNAALADSIGGTLQRVRSKAQQLDSVLVYSFSTETQSALRPPCAIFKSLTNAFDNCITPASRTIGFLLATLCSLAYKATIQSLA